MGRKKWTAEITEKVFNREDNPYGKGKCWHCGRRICKKQRTSYDGYYPWNIDHYPVLYRDIEDQIFFGVTDTRDLSNLVPSCVKCNKSHVHEKVYWYYFYHSQFPCFKSYLINIFLCIFSYFLGYFSCYLLDNYG